MKKVMMTLMAVVFATYYDQYGNSLGSSYDW